MLPGPLRAAQPAQLGVGQGFGGERHGAFREQGRCHGQGVCRPAHDSIVTVYRSMANLMP
jgi:hypothetical protein